jgi:hypothetical protein
VDAPYQQVHIYLLRINSFFYLLFNRNGKNRPKIMPMFLACTLHASYLARLLFVGGSNHALPGIKVATFISFLK